MYEDDSINTGGGLALRSETAMDTRIMYPPYVYTPFWLRLLRPPAKTTHHYHPHFDKFTMPSRIVMRFEAKNTRF